MSGCASELKFEIVFRKPKRATGEVNLFDPAFTACPHQVFSHLRAHLPVARGIGVEGGRAGSVVLSRHEDVRRALQDYETFSSDIGFLRPMSPAPAHVDPPEHARFRELLKPWFSRQFVSGLEPFVRSEANRLMDAFVEREACEFQQEFGVPLPCNVMLHMMGLPPGDLDLLLAIKDKILHPQGGAAGDELKRDGVTVANAYFDKALDERMAEPAGDLLSDLVNKTVEGDQRFTRVEILRVCLALLLGGLDAPAAGLGCVMAYLARNPDRRRGLVESRPFVAGAVSELMRTEAPIMYVTRTTLRKVRVAGQKIPAGTTVLLLVGSASADENVFPDADRVDFERDPNPHLAFGLGRHRCIGEHLAQMVMEVALEEWHRRIPEYAIQKGETLIYRPVIRSPERLPLEWGGRART